MKRAILLSLLLGGTMLSAGAKPEEAVKALLARYDAQIPAGAYGFRFVQLAADGTCRSPIIFLKGASGYCGTGGCTMLIYGCDSKGGYRLLGAPSVVMPPVYLLRTQHHGYHDIRAEVRRKGAVVLRFDGSHYPENASSAPAADPKGEGSVVFTDEELFGDAQ